MKSYNVTPVLGFAVFTALQSAQAVPVHFQDFDPINKILFTGVLGTVSHSSDFNIVTSDGDGGPNIVGFNDSTDILSSATMEFELWGTEINGGLQKEKARFDVGSTTFFTPGNQILGTKVFGGTLEVSLLAHLQANGFVNYYISLVDQGLFNIDTVVLVHAKLIADGIRSEPLGDPIPVFDGGSTLVLMGAGLLGLAKFRSRKA